MKQTSKLAELTAPKEIDRKKILSVLQNAKHPLTYAEIARKCNWYNPNKASRRLIELVRDNKIVELDPRICTLHKSKCTTYAMVE